MKKIIAQEWLKFLGLLLVGVVVVFCFNRYQTPWTTTEHRLTHDGPYTILFADEPGGTVAYEVEHGGIVVAIDDFRNQQPTKGDACLLLAPYFALLFARSIRWSVKYRA